MPTPRHPTPLAVALLLLAALSAPTFAQNALDAGQQNRPDRPDRRASPIKQETITTRGRALDANSQVGSSGINAPVANFQQELALRNAVVTGNVAGGKAFRGDVGYSAADDFRADTGSDDLFEFQRDSAYSGLATQNVRGITPLQFQLTESTAGQTEGMLGNLIIRRSSAGKTSAEAAGAQTSRITVDPYGNLRGSLRSTSDFVLRNARFPFVLGSAGKEEEGASRLHYVANPLLGVKSITLGNSAFSLQERPDLVLDGKFSGIGRKELADATRDGLSAPVGKRLEPLTPLDSLRSDLAKKSDTYLSKRYGEKPEKADESDRKTEPEATDPTESIDQRFDRMLEEVRKSFRQRLKTMEEQSPPSEEPNSLEPGAEQKKIEDAEKKAEEGKTLTPEEITARARALLGNGEVRLQALLDTEGVDDLYSWHMKKGEIALKADHWFEAEERFTAALRAKPGDAIAASARINSQIGGSLFLSAGVNLRNLFTAYPELIAARYAEDLFPTGKRLDAIRFMLRERMTRDTQFAREAALILAYVGWQSQTPADTADAFAALEQFHNNAGEEPEALERVLKEVWLNN